MQQFLRKVAIFGAGFMLINILSYLFIARPMLYEDYIVSQEALKGYDQFLFADSHGRAVAQDDLAAYGIYNFAYGSDSYVDIYAKIVYLYEQGIHPDTIFLSVDDHMLSEYRDQMNNLGRSVWYSNLPVYRQYYQGNSLSYYADKYLWFYFPMFNTKNSILFYGYLRSLLAKPKTRHTSWGDANNKSLASRNRAQMHFSAKNSSVYLKDCLQGIIDLCRRHHTTLMGIKFPLTDDYIKASAHKSYHADQVFISHNLPIINLKNVFTHHDNFFTDPDHLNAKGSREFARLLDEKSSTYQAGNALSNFR